MKPFFVYILQCADGTFYTGWTMDLHRRLHAHDQGVASKYTRSRRPLKLVYQEAVSSKSEALKREFAIKKLSRLQKESLLFLSSK